MHACDDLSLSYLVPYDMDLSYIKCCLVDWCVIITLVDITWVYVA